MKMIEVAIPYSERVGRSKLSVVRDGYRFGHSIVWTALNYNPVRLLGLFGLGALALAAVIGLVLVLARMQGIQNVGAIGAFALFSGLVLGVAGVSILTLGVSFNYFVALFHKTPVKQGLFGKPIFPGLEQHFGWIGVVTFVVGIVVALASFVLALNGWTLTQLWLYYLTSASLALIGIQLVIAWVQLQVFDTLSIRNQLAADDLRGKETKAPEARIPVDMRPESMHHRA
jgi:hypothetical protein